MIVNRQARALARAAFTLMEMLVVVAIIVVLAGAAVPIYLNYLDNAKLKRARIDVETLSREAKNYKAVMDEYPPSLDALTQPAQGWKPTLKPQQLIDPWNRP